MVVQPSNPFEGTSTKLLNMTVVDENGWYLFYSGKHVLDFPLKTLLWTYDDAYSTLIQLR